MKNWELTIIDSPSPITSSKPLSLLPYLQSKGPSSPLSLLSFSSSTQRPQTPIKPHDWSLRAPTSHPFWIKTSRLKPSSSSLHYLYFFFLFFFVVFSFTYGSQESLSPLLVVYGFGNLGIVNLCSYIYESLYLWVYVCIFVSFLCIRMFMRVWPLVWVGLFFFDVCVHEESSCLSAGFGLGSFLWCMGEREMKEEEECFKERYEREVRREKYRGLWCKLYCYRFE